MIAREDGDFDAGYLPRPGEWRQRSRHRTSVRRRSMTIGSRPGASDSSQHERSRSFSASTLVVRVPVRTLFLLLEELRAPMFDEAAVRETEHVQRLTRDDDAGLVDSIPTKTHSSPLLVGDEILDGHVDTFVATHCLHDLSKAVGASNLLLAQP
jgi:hypothetical protein